MADYRISYDEQGHSNGMTFRMCLQEATLKLAELAKGIAEATNPATTINTVDITFNYLEHDLGQHGTFGSEQDDSGLVVLYGFIDGQVRQLTKMMEMIAKEEIRKDKDNAN